jgi:phage FluMu protein Com
MATVSQTQIRCSGCNRRLADVVNEVEAGQVLVELKCPRCGQPHLEVIRSRRLSPAEESEMTVRVNERV